MREISLARKYSKALVETVKDEKEYKKIKSELSLVQELLNSDDDFKMSMETPLLSYNQKLEILNIVKDKVGLSSKVYKFFQVVLEENRMIYFGKMFDLLDEYWFRLKGVEKLKVYSAYPLDGDMEKSLIDKLQKVFNKKVILEKQIDKSLLAGIKIEKGSIFYDFSIKGNLKKLKESLVGGFSTQEN